MNTTYRAVFNESLGTWVAVSEIAKSHGKRSSVRKALTALAVAASLMGMQGMANAGEIDAEAAVLAQPTTSQDIQSADAAACEPELDAAGLPIADACKETATSGDQKLVIGAGVVAGLGGLAALLNGGGGSHASAPAPGIAPVVAPDAEPAPSPAPLPGVRIVNATDTQVSAGQICTDVESDNATVINGGHASVGGEGAVGTSVTGNGAKVLNEAGATVTDGGTGTRISGSDAVVINDGETSVTGQGSTGTAITGNGATVTESGTTTVTDHATGIAVQGDDAQINLLGQMTVGNDATGVSLTGNGGNVVIGSAAQGPDAENVKVVGGNATGVTVRGHGNTVSLRGGITVDKDQNAADAAERFTETATGLAVTGSGNTVNLDGQLRVVADGEEIANSVYRSGSGAAETLYGVVVTGDLTGAENTNKVHLNGGVSFIGEKNALTGASGSPLSAGKGVYGSLVSVDGNSELHISGKSSVSGTGTNYPNIVSATNGARVVWENGTLDVDTTRFSTKEMYDNDDKSIDVLALLDVRSGATLDIADSAVLNAGIQSHLIDVSDAGSSVTNHGTLDLTKVNEDSPVSGTSTHISTVAIAAEKGARATNAGTILLNSDNGAAVLENDGNLQKEDYFVGSRGIIAMVGEDTNTAIINNGRIAGHGYNVYGMGAIQGTATNHGVIDLAPIVKDGPVAANRHGVGMYAGNDTHFANTNGIATNAADGVITMHNAGVGMSAQRAGTVINQGTINLVTDEGAPVTEGKLVGMAAYNGGTAVNDTTGVINIQTNAGKAFDADSASRIVNRGQIVVGEGVSPTVDNSDTAVTATPLAGVIAGTGQSVTLDDPLGYVAANHLTNYGAVTNAATLDMRSSWLLNQQGASFSSPSTPLTLAKFENKGTLTAGTVTSGVGYNRAGATMNVGLLSLVSGNNFFNEGNFHGSATAGSYTNKIANTGDWTVSEGDAIYGRLNLINQEGGTLRNTAPGTGALVNISSLPGGQPFNNGGTMTATDGYSALKTGHGDATDNPNNWLVNRSTGVINGMMNGTEKALISMGRATSFGNEGTINVQGNGAVGILGANTGYTTHIINAGTLNVGTEAGKADGTNGTGLVGIKGTNTANQIYNNTTGVINVYANNSYAFGGNGKVVNNGTVNLECDTGCAIFAPGSAAAITGSDKAIAAQTTAPSQGTVPTPAVEAPRMVLRGYQVGTNANGTAGTLRGSHLDVSEVKVDTAFAAGTAAKAVTFDNVFQGTDITGAQNIQSDSAVWTANAAQDAKGIDVTMTKNAYQDVVTDAKLKDAAAALEGAYSNNAVFQSLNLATAAEVTKGVSQLTGQGFGQAMNQAKVLSNRFNVLADNVKETPSGLGFNMVTRGTPGARLAGSEYDMAVLSSRFSVGDQGKVAVRYGVANLASIDAGSNAATSNGLSGVSQFAGVQYVNPIAAGLELSGDLQFEQHRLESSRSLNYGSVNETASSKNGQDKYRANFVVGKPVEVAKGFTVTPMMGLDMRQTRDHAVNEQGAGAYNLNVSGATTTAMDAIGGVKLGYQHANGLNASVRLQGGPNLFYGAGQRQASLAGAPDARFALPDATQRSRFNYNSTVSVGYAKDLLNLSANGYTADQDGVKDYGVMFKVVKQF
ncbi:ESPR-type extended signal peptide-containing protein [Cupriavidus campinensis]